MPITDVESPPKRRAPHDYDPHAMRRLPGLDTERAARVLGVVLLVVFVAGVVLSLLAGTPKSLPAVALGAPLLLHIARALVGAGLIGGAHAGGAQ